MPDYFFTIFSYFKYLLHAKNAHGLHSPFVYKLFTEVIRARDNSYEKGILSLRKRLINQPGTISYADPKTGKKHQKTIRSIGRKSASSHSFSYFLVKLINHQKYRSVLETGTSLGINTAYLHTSDAKHIYTLEGSEEIANQAQINFEQYQMDKVQLIRGMLRDQLVPALKQAKADLVFLDADHRSEAVRWCLEQIRLHSPATQCIVIHDIYWSKDMNNAWNEIIQSKQYPLTIDIFQAGLIFPQLEMEKQHFTLQF